MTSEATGASSRIPFHLGMLGPITLADYRDYLHRGEWSDGLPKGSGGSPVNLLCRELLERGQRLSIFTADNEAAEEWVLNGPLLRIYIVPIGRPRGRRPARDFFKAERRSLLGCIQKERPDVLHAQWTYMYALAAQASGIPHLITAHDAPLKVLRHEMTPYRVAHTLMAYGVLARARRVVSVSPYVGTHLRRYMLYAGETIVVPNGMPDELFALPVAKRRSEQRITYATILSGWTRLKNGTKAMEAFGLVRGSRPQDRLLMIGVGSEPGGPAELWGQRKGLDRGVEFCGPVPRGDIITHLSRDVDILVHPSLEESFSMVIAEASALGIPAIGGLHSGAIPWTLDDGRAGLLVDVRSAEQLAAGMLKLANDNQYREDLGARARRNALTRFHIRRVADAYVRLYHEALAQHGVAVGG